MYEPSRTEVLITRVASAFGIALGLFVAVAAFASHIAAFG